MQNNLFRNILISSIAIFFITTSIIPIARSHDYVDNVEFEELYNLNQSIGRFVYRSHYFGRIHNLSVDGDNYEFESNNIRTSRYWRFGLGFRNWGFEYRHITGDSHFSIGGFRFRGILRPNFICGCFYSSIWLT